MANAKQSGLSARVQRTVAPMQLDMKQVTRTASIFNENQVQKLFNSTPDKYKYTRPAKGSGNWTYVRASYVRRTLDSLFGFNWDFEVMTPDDVAFTMAERTGYVSVRGRLTGRVKVDGEWIAISREQYGRAEVKFRKDTDSTGRRIPLDFGNDLKGATSDALKKCASMLGIASDVYDPEEFMQIDITGSDEASDRAKNAKRMADKNRTLLDAPSTVVPAKPANEEQGDARQTS